MGRQIHFYMLPEDCRSFQHFVQERDPVVIIPHRSKSPEIHEVHTPCKGGGFYLWNQGLLPSLEYKHVAESKIGPYYTVDDSLPVLEFLVFVPQEWNGRPALGPGRLYTGWSAEKGPSFKKWFNALTSWIRRNFVSSPDKFIGGYVGPAALEWFKRGGIFLPMFYPPANEEWLAVFETQDRIRKALTTNRAR